MDTQHGQHGHTLELRKGPEAAQRRGLTVSCWARLWQGWLLLRAPAQAALATAQPDTGQLPAALALIGAALEGQLQILPRPAQASKALQHHIRPRSHPPAQSS